ncbi:hypothetical protein Tco_0429057 [Tanacetum coccineum]
MCNDDEEGRDLLEFITWVNTKFKDHKRVDETTKHASLHSWIEVGKNEGLMDDIISSDEEWEEHEYGNPPNTIADSSSKPYLGAHHKGDASDHKKCNGNTSELESNILNKAPHSGGIVDDQLNRETCKIEKFEVIKHSLGDNEEFLAICTREYNSWT